MGVEKRKFARHDIDRVVQIETPDGSSVRGVLADLSQGGVRIKVGNPAKLPDQFMLKLSDKVHRWSRIAWRSAKEVGVEFLAAPHALPDSKSARPVFIRCPRTGRGISTGIRLTIANDLSKLSNVRRFAQCPHCKVVHGWNPTEALLTEKTPA